MTTYRFRPATLEDLDLLNAWQRAPQVAAWWDSSVSHTADDLVRPTVTMMIVEADGRPFAFIQDYDVHGSEGHHFGYLPPASRGLDQFIGPPDMVGRGHGPAFIAQRMGDLFRAGAPALAVDPHPDNARAIAAYRKIGFEVVGEAQASKWGPILPMEAWR